MSRRSENPCKPSGIHKRRLDIRPIPSATFTSQTRDEVPDGAFFLFVSKGFSEAIRLSETGVSAEIGLSGPRVSFHPPCTQIETDSKYLAISACWGNLNAPQLKRFRVLSVRTETPEGGVVVRAEAHVSESFDLPFFMVEPAGTIGSQQPPACCEPGKNRSNSPPTRHHARTMHDRFGRRRSRGVHQTEMRGRGTGIFNSQTMLHNLD